jgi:hypothetical protein
MPEQYRNRVPGIADSGNMVGVYRNRDDEQSGEILVTENGLFVNSSPMSYWVRFSEIASIQAPSAESESAEIQIMVKSGTVYHLRISGRDGRFRDVFNFVRFLDRVLEDINKS